MNRLSRITVLSLLLALPHAVAAPADAQRIEKTYQLKLDNWSLEMRLATTQEQRAKAWSNRPDATPAAREMWNAISGSLDQDWTLAPAAWFLRTTPGLLATDGGGVPRPIFTKENDAIRQAIVTYHLKSPKISPVCAALAFNNDPRSLGILDKIVANHPDPKIQGLAALGAAMQLKALGDDGEIMRRRLTLLRKAIIQSADVDLDGTTVAKRAEEELYIINFLTKGRVAPNLVGMDSAGRPLSLDSYKGKIIILLFWNSNVPDAKRVVDMTNALDVKYRGSPVSVIGVNNDTLEKLRSLQADSTVPWTNFSDPGDKLANDYRIGARPLVYVLDGERRIHYAGPPGSFAELTVDALLNPEKPAK